MRSGERRIASLGSACETQTGNSPELQIEAAIVVCGGQG